MGIIRLLQCSKCRVQVYASDAFPKECTWCEGEEKGILITIKSDAEEDIKRLLDKALTPKNTLWGEL